MTVGVTTLPLAAIQRQALLAVTSYGRGRFKRVELEGIEPSTGASRRSPCGKPASPTEIHRPAAPCTAKADSWPFELSNIPVLCKIAFNLSSK